MTTILDYGMGNLRSVERALSAIGEPSRISSDLEGAERLIIPGVGAFAAAMIAISPLRAAIQAHVDAGRPLLGICLGMQLMFDASEEHGVTPGLGVFDGVVRYLPPKPEIKVPHMGWNTLEFAPASAVGRGLDLGDQVYFVHSLAVFETSASNVAAHTEHGTPFISAVVRDRVWGVQFHPEKSSAAGLQILRNWLAC